MRIISRWILIPVAVLTISGTAYAREADLNGATTENGKVVIAAIPLISKKARDLLIVDGKMKGLLPVGVVVINAGERDLRIGNGDVRGRAEKKIYVRGYVPYTKGPFGFGDSREYAFMAEEIYERARRRFVKSDEPFNLTMGQHFRARTIKPGAAYFAVSYLDARTSIKRRRSLGGGSGIEFVVPFYDPAKAKVCRAALALDGRGAGRIECGGGKEKGLSDSSPLWTGVRYIGPDGAAPSASTMREVRRDMIRCRALSLLETEGKDRVLGSFAIASVKFDRDGNRLESRIVRPSEKRRLNRTMDEVIEGMERCELKSALDLPENEGLAAYEFTFAVGDSVALGMMIDDELFGRELVVEK